jgi:hypothetical protein
MQIKFGYLSDAFLQAFKSPMPSSKLLPEWYKGMSSTSTPSCPFKHLKNWQGSLNTSLKSCVPFRDALTTGYTFVAEKDIQFKLTKNNTIEYSWRDDPKDFFSVVSHHDVDQVVDLPGLNINNNLPLVFKWNCFFNIQTPAGYSTFFTHPLNRYELPFLTYSGIVDTDTYNLNVNFPFQITYKFKDMNDVLIIPEGTPLCTLFPFKRQNWNSIKMKIEKDSYDIKIFNYFKKIVNAYKSRYWHKKIYK